MKSFACITCWLLCFNFWPYSQDIPLARKLESLKTLQYVEWERAISEYYKERGIDLDQGGVNLRGTGFNQVKRLMWYYQSRLDKDGNITNTDIYNWRGYRDFIRQSSSMPELQASEARQNGQWVYGGPFNTRNKDGTAFGIGRVTFIKLDPNDAANPSYATIYVGAPKGGLWKGVFNKTTALVSSWESLTDGLPNIGVVDICIHPANRNIIYMVSGDKNAGVGNVPNGIGILKTTDGGITWIPTNFFDDEPPSFSFGTIRKLIMDSSNPLRMWAATTQGIYKTNDGWATFALEISGNFWDIEKGRNSSNQFLLACTSQNVYESNDYGDTWIAIKQTGSTSSYSFVSKRAELAVSADFSSNRSFYLWYVNGNYNSTTNTFKLYNGSLNTWFDRTATGATIHVYSDYCMAIEVSQTDYNTLYAGGVGLQKSGDGANSWTDFENGIPSGGVYSGDIHADQHYMAWDQGFLFLGNDGGVYAYHASSGGWRYLSDGMHITQYYRISYVNNANGFRAMGGSQDNGTHSSGTRIGCCDGMESLIDYNNPNTLYLSWQGGEVAKSTDGGNSLTSFYPSGFPNGDAWITPMAMHKTNPAIIALGELNYSGGQIQVYNGSWKTMGSTSSGYKWLAFAKNNPNVLYGVTEGAIIKIDDVTAASPTVSNYILPSSGITSVAVDPANSAHVFVTAGGYSSGKKVWESTTSGQSWTPVSFNLPNVPVNCVLVNQSSFGEVYVGTDIGVFVKPAGFSYWLPFMNGLPNSPVMDLEIDAGLLTCATYGRGRWYTAVYGNCLSQLDLTPANDPSNPHSTGQQYYTAGTNITSTRVITGGYDMDVTYRAGSSITLNPGFEARRTTSFRGIIGPCLTNNSTLGNIPLEPGASYDSTILPLLQPSQKPARPFHYLHPPINWNLP